MDREAKQHSLKGVGCSGSTEHAVRPHITADSSASGTYLQEGSLVSERLRVLRSSLQPQHELAYGRLHFKLLSCQTSDHLLELSEVGLGLALVRLSLQALRVLGPAPPSRECA
jgi:hypothetical protein